MSILSKEHEALKVLIHKMIKFLIYLWRYGIRGSQNQAYEEFPFLGHTALCLMLASRWFCCLVHSSTLKMEVIFYSETSVDFQRTTWRYIPEGTALICEQFVNHRSTLNRDNKLANNFVHGSQMFSLFYVIYEFYHTKQQNIPNYFQTTNCVREWMLSTYSLTSEFSWNSRITWVRVRVTLRLA
jgi:hypothetical protein